MGSFDEIDLDMERDPRTMTRDELLAAVLTMRQFFDRYGQVDRRYVAEDLHPRWAFRSPVGRWETVTKVDDDERPWVRVWTDKTGPDWSWRFLHGDKLEASAPFEGNQFDAEPEVRVIDLTLGRNGQLLAVITFRHVEIPAFGRGNSLADATYDGPGKGWTVRDRPGGGAIVSTTHGSKAKARTALLRAVRAHAKALGVPVRIEERR